MTNVASLQPHQIKSITLVQTSRCAFVNFKTRHAAEEAALRCAAKVDMGGQQVRVAWGRSRPKKAGTGGGGVTAVTASPTTAKSAAVAENAGDYGMSTN